MKEILVNDVMQKYKYKLTEPIDKNFHKNFKPHLTPKEMLELGVFGGKYMTDGINEYPKNWFTNAKLSKTRNKEMNYFKINASQALSVWKEKEWIHKDDPRGWFQWYCRYYFGRRHEDDERQIKRWIAFKRHWTAVKNNCIKGDKKCRPRQKQALLHWSYDSRKL